MEKLNQFLTIVMAAFFGTWVGNSGMVVWKYLNFPEQFAIQSAPWYTQIWVQGLTTAAVLLVCFVIKLVIKKIRK